MEQSAERRGLDHVHQYVPVNEYGDRDRQFGYLYDERDGTGLGPDAHRRRPPPRAGRRTTCSCTSAVTAARARPPARRHRRARIRAGRAPALSASPGPEAS